jgi:ubiquinone/menaquinone biosynthesis C-methylase UbiE/DNA-binding MarR family transcriptional regulator
MLSIYERMTSLAEPVRGRMLLALERQELTVGELQSVLQLPQSTVSRHLKTLAQEGWISSRAEGTSRMYRLVADKLDATARKLWALVREQVAASSAATQDARRLQAVLARRRGKSQKFFSASVGKWDAIRANLFGQRADAVALLGLLDSEWTVGDLGCGTGQVSETIAPFVNRVVAVDESNAMLSAARKRLAERRNVSVRAGSLESLPLEDGELDAAFLFLVLHYVVDPAKAIAEAARTLRPGGRLLIADMTPHERQEFEQVMGHLWLGFPEPMVAGWMRDADLMNFRYVPLPADPDANGPTLFAATATKKDVVAVEEIDRARRKHTVQLRKTA